MLITMMIMMMNTMMIVLVRMVKKIFAARKRIIDLGQNLRRYDIRGDCAMMKTMTMMMMMAITAA